MKDFAIVGVDISKLTLDFHFKPSGKDCSVTNNADGFSEWLELARELSQGKTLLVVMEHTGKYSRQLEILLQDQGISYCKVPAIEIKKSLGMTRGKADKIDAQRIAGYAWLRREILVADQPVQEAIESLKHLLSLRLKLVRDRAGYLNRQKESRSAGITITLDLEEQIIHKLTVAIKEVESQIRLLIASKQELQKTFNLLLSIAGVGFIVAASMIGYTHGFKRFANARKFNCYAGIAPFDHQSGTSIKTRSRVSHLANKESKTLLNLAALSAIKCDPEITEYYNRRVKEGKSKMACINIVRSKIVARMFAVVKRGTLYQKATNSPFNPTLKN
jgi:transposase